MNAKESAEIIPLYRGFDTGDLPSDEDIRLLISEAKAIEAKTGVSWMDTVIGWAYEGTPRQSLIMCALLLQLMMEEDTETIDDDEG